MSKIEEFKKELKKKPTNRAWQNLCSLFNEATEDEKKEGLQLAKPILKSKKWKSKMTYFTIEMDASLLPLSSCSQSK